MTVARPLPRWPGRLLSRLLPDRPERATMVGDLHEEYSARPAGVRRTLAYAAACLALAAHYAPAVVRGRRRRTVFTFESLRLDCRHAVAGLRRARTYAAVTTATLTIGVGATATILSIVYGALLKPLPLPSPGSLARIGSVFPESASGSLSSMSVATFLDLQRATRRFAAMGAYNLQRSVLMTPGLTERVMGAQVTGGFLAMLGVRPTTGRLLSDADDTPAQPPVVVTSRRLAERLFGSPASALGRSVSNRISCRTSSLGWYLPKPTCPADLSSGCRIAGMLPRGQTAAATTSNRSGDCRLACRFAKDSRSSGPSTPASNERIRPRSAVEASASLPSRSGWREAPDRLPRCCSG